MVHDAIRKKLPAKLEGIVFDVDGTMYDQRCLRFGMLLHLSTECLKNPVFGTRSIRFLRAYRNALEELRAEPGEIDISALQLEIACEKAGISSRDGRRIVERSFQTAPLAELPGCIRPGLIPFLRKCRSNGLRLGVFSDYPAAKKLEVMGLGESFDSVVCSTDTEIGHLKPHPAGLERCVTRLGIEPEHTLYVGDRIDVDAECAVRAKVCPIIIHSRAKSDMFLITAGFEGLSSILF